MLLLFKIIFKKYYMYFIKVRSTTDIEGTAHLLMHTHYKHKYLTCKKHK
jgi:hypothetical protein